ncbi:hypothetical protein ACI2OX_22125 [Bacillus sp. N9]
MLSLLPQGCTQGCCRCRWAARLLLSLSCQLPQGCCCWALLLRGWVAGTRLLLGCRCYSKVAAAAAGLQGCWAS